MPSKRKKQSLVCPCCKVTRGDRVKKYLHDIELKCSGHNPGIWWSNKS